MTYTYKTQGTCSKLITIDIDEDGQTIQNVSYTGGCNGNLKGIAALVKGRKIDEVKNTLAESNADSSKPPARTSLQKRWTK